MGRLDRIPDVLAVSMSDFPSCFFMSIQHGNRISRIRPCLFASNVELRRPIDHWAIRTFHQSRRRLIYKSLRMFFPRRFPAGFQVFEHAFMPPFPAEAAFPITSESGRCIELVRTIDPDHSSFEPGCNIERQVDVFTPYTGSKSVGGVVCQGHRFIMGPKGR